MYTIYFVQLELTTGETYHAEVGIDEHFAFDYVEQAKQKLCEVLEASGLSAFKVQLMVERVHIGCTDHIGTTDKLGILEFKRVH